MQVGEERELTIRDFFSMAQDDGGIYEIDTPNGWIEVGCLVRKNGKRCYSIRTAKGRELKGSSDHLVESKEGWINLENLDVDSCSVNTCDGLDEVVSKEYLGVHDTFDLQVKSKDHKYYSNGIVSHNTGKTTIGHIICSYSEGYTVIWITPETIIENQFRAMTSMKLLYKLADYLSPCVVIIEDLDLIGRDREEGGDIALGSLMNILDGVNSITNSITVGTTNRLQVIEKALRNRPGRFDRVVEIPPMEEELREKMFSARLVDWGVEEGLIEHLVGSTDGWTPAEVQEFINGAHLKHINSGAGVKYLTKKWADEIIEMMQKFGIGEASSGFGFSKRPSN
jgi:hypothetical protein